MPTCRNHCERRVGRNRIENPIENDALPPGGSQRAVSESNVAVQAEAKSILDHTEDRAKAARSRERIGPPAR